MAMEEFAYLQQAITQKLHVLCTRFGNRGYHFAKVRRKGHTQAAHGWNNYVSDCKYKLY